MPGGPSRDRTFQSREVIWNTFESMAREQGAPIDELVNDAMAAYARVRGYTVPTAPPAPTPSPAPMGSAPSRGYQQQPPRISEMDTHDRLLEETRDAPQMSALDRSYDPRVNPIDDDDDDDLARTSTRQSYARPGGGIGLGPGPSRESGSNPFAPPPPRGQMAPPAAGRPATQAMPRMPSGGGGPPPGRAPMAPMGGGGGGPPPMPGRMMPPTTMPMPDAPRRDLNAGPSMGPGPSAQKRLVLVYQGRQYIVDKDRYLLGRSKTQSDLRLDDPNVSRQHAVIEKVGSAYYVVDLGSTNGVQIGAERVARRAIAEGDVITITSHEIRCMFR